MFTDYNKRKEEVLAHYESFVQNVKALKKLAVDSGLPNPTLQYHSSLADAGVKATNIRADRFRLMVAGESKSGKSSFINAYLGVEILPMDVEQCSSAIVEIKYGEPFRLRAQYANGMIVSVNDEDAIRRFLKDNAALNDEWRDIPVPSINQELLVKSGRRVGKGNPANVPEQEIKDFLNSDTVKAANINHIPNYEERIREYISKHSEMWEQIVVNIEIFYPFAEESLKGIEIVDSPGVCTRGGVSEFTMNYIEEADAIIFLKSIAGQSLLSSQFSDFMDNVSVGRNKNALFLVLTHASDLTANNLVRQTEAAHKQFTLDESHILVVDSKAKLYIDLLEWSEDIMAQLQAINAKGDLDNFVMSKWVEATGDSQRFKDILLNLSGFRQIENALAEFGRKAHYIALAQLLNLIDKIYVRILGDVESNLELFRQKAVDPTELAKKIADIKHELEVINNKMYKGVEEKVSSYTRDEGIIKKKADEVSQAFETAVEKINANDINAFTELNKLMTNAIYEYKIYKKKLEEDVVEDFNTQLIELSTETEIPYTSLEPDFSESTFNEIRNRAKDSPAAKESIPIIEKRCGKEKVIGYRPVTSQQKYFAVVKHDLIERLSIIKKTLFDNLTDYVRNIGSYYTEALKQNADAKKAELNAVYEAKQDAERIRNIIDQYSYFIVKLRVAKTESAQIRGGIEKYVR